MSGVPKGESIPDRFVRALRHESVCIWFTSKYARRAAVFRAVMGLGAIVLLAGTGILVDSGAVSAPAAPLALTLAFTAVTPVSRALW